LVSALAMGARKIAAPTAAAPNPAMYLIVGFMMLLLFAGSPYVAASNDCALANQCRHGYRPFSSEASWNLTLAAN
jgi:hypothetical protein